MVEVGTYFKYSCKNPWTEETSISILQVTKVHLPWVTLRTLDNKSLRRKLKTRPSGLHYVEHDAFNGGNRNKFDEASYEVIASILGNNFRQLE